MPDDRYRALVLEDDLVILTPSGGAVGGSATVRQAEAAAAAAVVGARRVHLDVPDTYLVPAEGETVRASETIAWQVRGAPAVGRTPTAEDGWGE